MMPDESVNPVDAGGSAVDGAAAQRKAEIFEAMLQIADRRRRGRRIKQVAGVSLGAVAAAAVVVGVIGSLPPARLSPGNDGATVTTVPVPVQPVPPMHDVAILPDTTKSQPYTLAPSPTSSSPSPNLASAGGRRGVLRLDESKLRRVVVAEPLTDEAFEQELAMQGEYGTVRVGGRVLVLNNRSVAEDSPPRVH